VDQRVTFREFKDCCLPGYAAAFTGGSWPSFVSYNVIFPAKNIGVFLTTNGPGELLPEFDHIAVAHMLFDIMRGLSVSFSSQKRMFSKDSDLI